MAMTKEQAIALASARLRLKQRQADPPVTGGDVVREALQGATFNFGDELRAGASAALGSLAGQGDFGDLYRATRDYERGQSEQFNAAHPIAAGASQFAGGLLTGVPIGAAAGTTAAGKQLARHMATRGLLDRIGTTAAISGGAAGLGGVVAGAGAANEIEDIPAEVTRGGLLSGAVGATLGPALEIAGSSVRGARDVARRVRDPDIQAAKNVDRALKRAGLTPEEARMRAEMLGPDATLADVSEATRETLESAANQPGQARDMAMRQLTERSRKQAATLLDDLGPGKKHATLGALKKFREDQAAPLYRKAFDQGVPHTQTLEDVFNSLEEFSPGIWREAKKLGALALRNKGKTVPDLGDARPTLEGWQYVKEKLDDRIDAAYRSGEGKVGAALADARSRLLGELDSLNPDYKQARNLWAGTKQFESRMKDAEKFMTATGADFEAMMAGLSSADREAVKVGAIQAIEDKIERGQWTQDVAKFFRTPAMERKMRALFGDPKAYAKFRDKLNAVTQTQRTFDAVRGNSATSRREAARADQNDWIAKAMDATTDVLTGSTSGILRNAARLVSGKAGLLDPRASEAARDATARLLLETDPARRAMQHYYGQGLLLAPPPAGQYPLLSPVAGGLLGAQAAQ